MLKYTFQSLPYVLALGIQCEPHLSSCPNRRLRTFLASRDGYTFPFFAFSFLKSWNPSCRNLMVTQEMCHDMVHLFFRNADFICNDTLFYSAIRSNHAVNCFLVDGVGCRKRPTLTYTVQWSL